MLMTQVTKLFHFIFADSPVHLILYALARLREVCSEFRQVMFRLCNAH
jgi:hypothetical protein